MEKSRRGAVFILCVLFSFLLALSYIGCGGGFYAHEDTTFV